MEQVSKRTLGELLRHHRLKAELRQGDLAQQLGYNHSHISRIERNTRMPTDEYIRSFIQTLALPEAESAEIIRLYQEATGTGSEHPFSNASLPATLLQPAPQADLREAPDIYNFYGRETELAQLEGWVLEDRCRLITIYGMGGIGKTTLVTKLARQIQTNFAYTIWRSLQNGPSLAAILSDCLQFFSNQQEIDLNDSNEKLITRLITYLDQQRCLLIFDNVETIMQDVQAGYYLPGYEEYGRLFQRIGEGKHQSCLILTSREKPKEVGYLEGDDSLTHSLQLSGLGTSEGQQIVASKGLSGSEEGCDTLVKHYSGNPLALNLVAEMIREIYDGDIDAFLVDEQMIFGRIEQIIAGQFDRLSLLEQSLMFWLAIEREPVSRETLFGNHLASVPKRDLMMALQSLRRRSFLEQAEQNFMLQNVVLEYTTNRLINQLYTEIADETISLLNSHAVIKAQTKDYIRNSQARLILQPLVERLDSGLGGKAKLEELLNNILSQLRKAALPSGYASSNVLNILIWLQSELHNFDFSHLSFRQAYLRDVSLNDVTFKAADFSNCVFADTFGGIFAIAVSPDSNLLAAGTTDSDIRLWRIADRKQLYIFKGHTAWIRSIAFSPASDMLASASSDHTIRLWNPRSGQILITIQGHEDRVRCVTFDHTGKLLASASDDYTIRIWDVNNGQLLNVFTLPDHPIRSVAFSPTGALLVSDGENNTVQLRDAHTGQCIKIFEGHQKKIDIVAFHPNGRIVASGSSDHTVRLWDIETGETIHTLQSHDDRIRSIVFSPDGNLIASGSNDHKIRLWDTETGHCLKIMDGHTNWVRSLAFSFDNHLSDSQSLHLISGSDDKTVRFWDAHTGKCIDTLQGYTNWVWSIDFSPDGKLLATGSEDHVVRLWDMTEQKYLNKLTAHTNRVNSVRFSPNGLIYASASDDQTIRIWDVKSGKQLSIWQGHTGRVSDLSFSPDGQQLASTSSDQTIRIWDVKTGTCLQILSGHIGSVWSVDFSPNQNIMVSCGDDQTIRLWDTDTGEPLNALTGHTERISSVTFNRYGDILASGSDDQTIRLWDVKTGQCLRTLQGHSSRIWSVTFNPNNQTLASSSEDQTIIIWDMHDGSALKTFTGHLSRIRSIVYQPNSPILASAGDDGVIKLWETEQELCIETLRNDRPYERMDITGVTGLTDAEKTVLKTLGATEKS